MSCAKRLCSFGLVAVCLAGPAGIESRAAGVPVIQKIAPLGGQRGTEFTLSVEGENLIGAAELLFYGSGLAATKIEADPESKGKIRVTIKSAADCPLGEHPFRLRTGGGLSDLYTLLVGPFPEVAEQEPNNDISKAQAVSRNMTVTGSIEELDVDCFAITARRGERLSAEVEGLRFGTELFDPHVSIRDAEGTVLSERDDTNLLGLDSYASILVPKDGTYYVQVRESALGGSPESVYRLHVGLFPRPGACYPAGGQAGDELTVRLIGDPAGPLVNTVKLPDEPTARFALFPEAAGETAPSPNWLRVSPFPNALEREPNDRPDQAGDFISTPVALNGVLEKKGDVDCFRVRMRRGEMLDIEVFAQRVRSPVDPVLTVLSADGRVLVENDDASLHDSRVRFHVPEDGEYFVQIADHLRRGGEEFVYRVEIHPPEPHVTLTVTEVERGSQQRQTIAVPRGGRFATLFAVQRHDVADTIKLSASGLPPGVTMRSFPIPAHQHVTLAVFEAAADAPLAAGLVDVRGQPAGGGGASLVVSRFEQRVGVVKGRREVFRETTVDRLAVAVTDASPFRLSVDQPRLPVARDGRVELRVRAERQPGFDKAIRLQLPLQPPYIERPNEEAQQIDIAEGASEALFPLIATPDAPADRWPLTVLGRSETADGVVWASSDFIMLTVAEPNVSLAIRPAETEAGQPVEMICELQTLVPFDGPATLKLAGLPKGTTAPERTVDQTTREVTFPVSVTDATPIGIHNAVYCELTIVRDGEPSTQFVGRGGVLDVRARGTPAREKRSRLTVLRQEREAKSRADAARSRAGQ